MHSKKKKKLLLFNKLLLTYIYIYCGVIKPSDLHPPFVLGLRPMPKPIIAYEEGSGDHDNLGSHAKDNPVLS